MCVRAINLNEIGKDDEIQYRVLAEIVGEDRQARRINFNDVAEKLGITRQLVAYHVRRLVACGYLTGTENGYAPTKRILILEQ